MANLRLGRADLLCMFVKAGGGGVYPRVGWGARPRDQLPLPLTAERYSLLPTYIAMLSVALLSKPSPWRLFSSSLLVSFPSTEGSKLSALLVTSEIPQSFLTSQVSRQCRRYPPLTFRDGEERFAFVCTSCLVLRSTVSLYAPIHRYINPL